MNSTIAVITRRPPSPTYRPTVRPWIGSLLVLVGAAPSLAGAQASPPPPPIAAMAFSPDGKSLVVSGHRRLVLHSIPNLQAERAVDIAMPKITSIAFSPTGKVLGVAGGSPGEKGAIQLLAWPACHIASQTPTDDDWVTSFAFSPDGSRMVFSDAGNSATVVSAETLPGLEPLPRTTPAENSNASSKTPAPPEPIRLTLRGHAAPVLATAWAPDGNLIVTASADRSIKVWSPADGRLLRTFTHHTEPPSVLRFQPVAPDNSSQSFITFASGGEDHTLRIWQPSIGRMVRIVRQHQGPVLSLAWAQDGTSLFSAGTEGVLRQIESQSDRIVSEWRAHDDWILSLAISPDGQFLASGDASGKVRLWNLRQSPPNLVAGLPLPVTK